MLKLGNALGELVTFLGLEVHAMSKDLNLAFNVIETFVHLGKVFADDSNSRAQSVANESIRPVT